MDRRTDRMLLKGAFRNFANAPNDWSVTTETTKIFPYASHLLYTSYSNFFIHDAEP